MEKKEKKGLEIRKIRLMLERNKRIITDMYWQKLRSTPEQIAETLELLERAVENYSELDQDSQYIVVCAVRNAVFYFNHTSKYWSRALEMAVTLIREEKEVTLAHDLVFAHMPLADRKKIVEAVECARLEEDVLGHMLHFNWDSQIDDCNCYMWLRLCSLFQNVDWFEMETRAAFLKYEKQVGTKALLEDDELCNLFARLPDFRIVVKQE